MAYILVESEITASVCRSVINAVKTEIFQGNREVDLIVSSTGGDMKEALTLFKLLKALDIQLSTYNVSHVYSSAVLVYLAGTNRYADENASFLLHEPIMSFDARTFTVHEAQLLLEELVSVRNRAVAVIVGSTGRTEDEVREWLGGPGSTFTAESAERHGIVTELKQLRLDDGSELSVLRF